MQHYSEERKSTIMLKLLPPLNQSVAEVLKVECIGESTLYNWLNQARKQGIPVPGNKPVIGNTYPA